MTKATPTLGEIFVRPLGIPHTKLYIKSEVSMLK